MALERDLASLAELSRLRSGVASAKELASRGMSPSAIRANLDARRWQRMHPGVYLLHTGTPSWPGRAWAALVYAGWPTAILSHASAAFARGWDLLPPETIDVTVPYTRRTAPQPGLRTHRSRAFLHIVDSGYEPPRTTAARTVADLLRSCPDATAATTMVLESMRRRRISVASLWAELQGDRGHPFRKVVLEALDHAGRGLQSILEVVWAELEVAHGLPIGRRQVKVMVGGSAQFQDVGYATTARSSSSTADSGTKRSRAGCATCAATTRTSSRAVRHSASATTT